MGNDNRANRYTSTDFGAYLSQTRAQHPHSRLALVLAERGHRVVFSTSSALLELEMPVIFGRSLPQTLTLQGINDGRSVQDWDDAAPGNNWSLKTLCQPMHLCQVRTALA